MEIAVNTNSSRMGEQGTGSCARENLFYRFNASVVRGALEGGEERGALLKEHDVTLLQRAIFFPVEATPSSPGGV